MLESEALGISVCHRLLFGSSTIALALLCILCERQTCQVPPMPNGLLGQHFACPKFRRELTTHSYTTLSLVAISPTCDVDSDLE